VGNKASARFGPLWVRNHRISGKYFLIISFPKLSIKQPYVSFARYSSGCTKRIDSSKQNLHLKWTTSFLRSLSILCTVPLCSILVQVFGECRINRPYSVRSWQPTKCQFYREKQKIGSILYVANAWLFCKKLTANKMPVLQGKAENWLHFLCGKCLVIL